MISPENWLDTDLLFYLHVKKQKKKLSVRQIYQRVREVNFVLLTKKSPMFYCLEQQGGKEGSETPPGPRGFWNNIVS